MRERSLTDKWVVSPRRNPAARLRLFCFPYGGAGASVYRTWPALLPSTIEVCAIQLPGRETRIAEAPIADIDEVILDLLDAMAPLDPRPFAFFGHSLGAFLAFEVARELHDRRLPGPGHLIVSGQRAPHLPNALPVLYNLPEASFVEQLQDRYNAIPAVVLESPQLMAALLPMLRADFTMHDTYDYVEGPPLECPIAAFGGDQDPEATELDLIAWKRYTTSEFRSRVFPGGHFYVRTAQAAILATVSDLLTPLLAPAAETRLA